MQPKRPNPKLQAWIDARKRHRLTHAQVQMARKLGMNPAKLGGLDNYRQEPWKLPLPLFSKECYLEQFGKAAPEMVLSIEVCIQPGSFTRLRRESSVSEANRGRARSSAARRTIGAPR
jgi:hypothetical protein